MIRSFETLEDRRLLASVNIIDNGNGQMIEVNGSSRADDMEIVQSTTVQNDHQVVTMKIWHNGKTQKFKRAFPLGNPVKEIVVNGFANRDTILVISNEAQDVSNPVVTINGDGDHDALEARGGRKTVLNGGEFSDSLIAVKAPIPVDGDPSFVLNGGPGNDNIIGSNAKDLVDATEGSDWVYAGDGDDTIVYANAADIQGGFGNDQIYSYYSAGNMGAARIDGEWGLDTLTFLTDDPNVTAQQAFEGVFTVSIEEHLVSNTLII